MKRAADQRTHPPVAIAPRPADPRTTRQWTLVVDAIAVIAAAVLLATIAAGSTGPVRAVCSVVTVLLVPGWTICRWCGWRFSASTLLTTCTTSVAVTIILGQVAVTRTDWSLETVGTVLCVVCLAALGLLHLTRFSHV